MHLQAEVIGCFDHPRDANALLYTPLDDSLTTRHTRRYLVDFEGDATAALRFLTKVLADPVSHELRTGDAPALPDYAFFLDYGMKAGALDHEKETILAHHHHTSAAAGFTISSLKIQQRIYFLGTTGTGNHAYRFVKDIVNPAVHTWQVTAAVI